MQTDTHTAAPSPAYPEPYVPLPVAEVLRRARGWLARRFAARCESDREDALQEAARRAVEGGWLQGPRSISFLSKHAAKVLCGGYVTRGVWHPSRSGATSIAAASVRVAGGDDLAELDPAEYLERHLPASPTTAPDAALRRTAALDPDPDRLPPAVAGRTAAATVRELVRRGWSHEEVAEAARVRLSDVTSYRRGFPCAPAARRRLAALLERPAPTDEIRALLTAVRAAGWSLSEVGEVCGVSKEAASRWLQGSPPAQARRAHVTAALRALLDTVART